MFYMLKKIQKLKVDSIPKTHVVTRSGFAAT